MLDAIAIYPELIQKILSEVETLTINDVNENNALEDGMLFSALRTFRVEEPGVGPENAPSYNIFDLPMLMKKSATTDTYYEANVIEMLRVELEEIKKYLSKLKAWVGRGSHIRNLKVRNSGREITSQAYAVSWCTILRSKALFKRKLMILGFGIL